MKRTLSDSQNNTGFHGKFGKLRRLSVNGGQGSELPTERLTQLCFRQVQVIRIGEDCQSVGEVDHILMEAAGNVLRIQNRKAPKATAWYIFNSIVSITISPFSCSGPARSSHTPLCPAPFLHTV